MAADLGSVGSAFVELKYSLDQLPAGLDRAKQLVQTAVDSLSNIRPSGSSSNLFAPLVSGADAAVSSIARVGAAAQETAGKYQALEQSIRRALQAMRELAAAPPPPPARSPAAGGGGAGSAGTGAVDVALERSATRYEAFQRAIQGSGAAVEQVSAAMERAASLFATFDEAVVASEGDARRLGVAQQLLARDLNDVRAALAANAAAVSQEAQEAANAATAQERIDATLARSAAQAGEFRRALDNVGAGERETAAAAGQAAAAFERYDAAVLAAAGNTSRVQVAGAQLRTDLGGIRAGLVESAAAAEASSGKIASVIEALTGVKSAGELVTAGIAGAFGGIAFQAVTGAIEKVKELSEAVVQDGEAWVLAGQRLQATLGLTQAQAGTLRQQLADATKGVSLDSTFDLAARIGPSLQEMGRSGTDLVRVVRTLNEEVAVSGTSAQGASRAQYELSRAFAEGTLNSRELRVIAGDMPAVLQLLGQGLGVTTGQLREMASAGQLTGQVLIDAITKAGPEVDQAYQGIGAAVSRAMTDVGNAFEQAAGKAAEDTGLIRDLGAAIETLADLLKSGPVQAGFNSLAKFFDDIAKGVTESKRQIEALKQTLNGGIAPAQEPTTPQGYFDRATARQRDAQDNINADDQLNKQFKGYQLKTDKGVSDEYAKQALADQNAGFALFAQHGGAGGGAAADEGTAESLAKTAVPAASAGLQKDLDQIDAKGQSVLDLKGKLAELDVTINGLLRPEASDLDAQAKYEERLNALQTERVKLTKELEAAGKNQLAQKLSDATGKPFAETLKTVNLSQNETANDDTPAKLKAQIAQLQAEKSIQVKQGDPEGAARTQQTILQTQQKLHELEQKKAEAAANTRDRLLEQTAALEQQADPSAKLVADETKLGQLVRQRAQAKLPLPAQDQATIQTSIGERFAKAVEQQAAAGDKGDDPLALAQAKLAALGQAQAKIGDLVKGEAAQRAVAAGVQKEQLGLQQQIDNLQGKSDEKLAGQQTANEKVLDNLRRQGAEAKAGFQDAALAIKEAGDAAADSIKLPTPEEQRTQGGREQAVKAESQQETARTLAEGDERLKLRAQVLQQVEGADTKYARTVAELNSDLKAGVITQEEYARAVVGVITPEQQFADATAKLKLQLALVDAQTATGNKTLAQRNQLLLELQAEAGRAAAAQRQAKVGQLYDRGEVGSGVGEGAAALGGLQAGGLEVIGQYGNIAKAAGATITGAFEQSTDALAQFIATGKGGLPQLEQSLEQLTVKMTIQLLLARALDAAFGAFAGGGAGAATQTALPSTAAGGLLGHAAHGLAFAGGSIVPMAKGGVLGQGGGLFGGPTLIPLSHGSAIAGEAGPEAAVPLVRTADGNLGVRTGGGGGANIEVHVHDQRQSGSPVDVQKSSDGQTIRVLIKDAVAEQFSTGQHDRLMRSRFGLTPTPTR